MLVQKTKTSERSFGMKKITCLILAALLAASSFLVTANAQNNTVKVQIPTFYTEIDLMSVDNRYVEYPFIVYKDVTYLPMTLELSKRFGFAVSFDAKDGLYVTKSNVSYMLESAELFGKSYYNEYGKAYDAVLPEYPIYLNGEKINNYTEEYPLLNFRGVTYFPLSWKYAVEEFRWATAWSHKDNSFKVYPYYVNYSGISPRKMTDEYIYFQGAQYEPVFSLDSGGNIINNKNFTGGIAQFRLDLESGTLERLQTTETEHTNETYAGEENLQVPELSVTDGKLHYDDTEIFDLPEKSFDTLRFTREYSFDDTSFLFAELIPGNAPPLGIQDREYIFKKTADGITQIEWDTKNNLSDILSDGKGGYFLCTYGYSPYGSGRHSNEYSDIYHMDKDGNITALSELYENINSIKLICENGGKLYVQAMQYTADKNMPGTQGFSPENSGFYEIDESLEIKKLYPYILGDVFTAPNGDIFCITDYARDQRLVNIKTGQILYFNM